MPITVTVEALDLDADARDVVADLADSLERHWTGALLAGQKAEGGALPANKQGKPYGQGDGNIATEWVTTPVEGNAARATASSSPGQEGGLFYVVRNMAAQGFNPASTDGKAADIIDQVVNRAADRAIKP